MRCGDCRHFSAPYCSHGFSVKPDYEPCWRYERRASARSRVYQVLQDAAVSGVAHLSLGQIAAAAQLRSPPAAYYHVAALVKEGKVRRGAKRGEYLL